MNQLIAIVKRHPELYNPHHVDFKDQQKKNSLWTLIALELGLESGYTAKSKWRNLKDSYVKYLRNGSTGNDRRYKNWPWAEQMEFLRPTLISRCPSLAAGSSLRDPLSEDEGSVEIHVTDEGPSVSKRRRIGKTYSPSFSQFNNGLNDYLLQDSDADDLLFLSYSKTLKTFSRKRQMVVKMEISKIMLEAEMLQATEDEQLEVKFEPENLDEVEEEEDEVIDLEPGPTFLYLDKDDKFEEEVSPE